MNTSVKPYLFDGDCSIYVGDALEVLKQLPEKSIQMCVTSPPYFGLRDYGTASWDGGDPTCDHSPEQRGSRFAMPVSAKQASNKGSGTKSSRNCPCGAIRVDRQLGLEDTPEEYVESLVEVFREVRRTLRDDGTFWLNIGDSYAGSGKGGNPEGSEWEGFVGNKDREKSAKPAKTGIVPPGFKPKDLIGVPWMLAFALRADGWWLRSDCIWEKNSMPESMKDRPTHSHEYVFLFSKSKIYYYDHEAVKEPAVEGQDLGVVRSQKAANGQGPTTRESIDKRLATLENRRKGNPSGMRNLRSVWKIPTAFYREGHYAVFPPEIPRRCIKAGSAPGDVILDPFAGSGTVGLVARQLNRKSILIELNPEFADQIAKRTQQLSLLA